MSNDDTLQRLRAADPAAAEIHHADSPQARLLLWRIRAEDGHRAASTRRRRLPGRAVAIGVGAVAVAAIAVVGVVGLPWNHGSQSNAAYAVDVGKDGSVDLTVHFADLRDPAALNRELAADHARTVAMPLSAPGACASSVAIDPAHNGSLRFTGPVTPAQIQQAFAAESPWVSWRSPANDPDVLLTIHPDLIPAGDQLLLTYALLPSTLPDGAAGPNTVTIENLPVTSLPSCVPATEDQVRDAHGIHPR